MQQEWKIAQFLCSYIFKSVFLKNLLHLLRFIIYLSKYTSYFFNKNEDIKLSAHNMFLE